MIKLSHLLNEAVKIQAKPNHWNTSDHVILVTPTPNKTYVLRFNNKNDSSPSSVTFPTGQGIKPIDTNKTAREFWLKVKSDVNKWRSTNESVNEAEVEGGHENDRDMVTGVAEIILMVNDMNNRKEIADSMLKKFNKEDVIHNVKEFLTLCGL